MSTPIQSATLVKLKELKEYSKKAEDDLEKAGISVTDINRKQLFDNNIKSTIGAIEGLLRNEPAERHLLRLKREIPDSYVNVDKLKETRAGKLSSLNLDKIKKIMEYFRENFENI